MSVKTFAAHVISIIFIPLLAPTYLFALVFLYFPQAYPQLTAMEKWRDVAAIFLSTSLPPFIVVFILFKAKVISSLTLERREDRVWPQVFSCINYIAITIFLYWNLSFQNVFFLIMLGTTISLIVITLVTPYWKISTHAAGVWGMLTICSALFLKFQVQTFFIPYIIIAVCTILVCLARLHLRVHTLAQVIAGSFLGIVSGSVMFYILAY